MAQLLEFVPYERLCNMIDNVFRSHVVPSKVDVEGMLWYMMHYQTP